MGRRGHRRSASQDEDNVGCVWGLMRMLYFRRDPKLLLDAKQLSGRHTFREVTERGHSPKWPNDFDEIEEDGNIEECTSQKPTVKNLMEDELGKVNLLKKSSNDEVQRRLADLGNDVSLDRSSEHRNKSTDNSYHQAGISTPSTPSMDSGVLNYAEEYDLESVLVNFLGEIYSCHNECSHSDCKNKNELCPSLKSLIHKKVNELNNLPRNIGCGQSQEGNHVKLSEQNNLSNTTAAQSKQFKDALEILGSNNELFVKLLQKPNPHIADSIQKHENSKVAAGLEPNKIHGQTNFVGGRGGSRQHPLATKEQAKERKYMFFWRKGKSSRRQMLDATDAGQTVSKIIILKPNPEREINQKAATARTLQQQPCTSHAPECSGRENSKFSIKEVKKRLRFVAGESRRERNLAPAEDLQGDPRMLKDSVIAINKDFRHLPDGSLANKSLSGIKSDIKPFISSKQKQQNGSMSEISGPKVAPKGASIFYEEAKRHLTEMLKGNDCSVNYPAVQISKSLEGILSLPHGNVSSPRSSLRGKDNLEPSTGETDAYVACEVDREECIQERSQLQEDLGSIACCSSSAGDDQVTVQEGYYTNEAQEGSRHANDEPGTPYIEGIDKFICGENICNGQSILGEQSRDDVCQKEILEELKQGKGHVKMSLTSAEGIVENLGQQERLETPEPRASTKFISDGSPEQSDENQERPSPISVLESFFEDIGSPDCINTKECELHGLQRTLYFADNEPDVRVLWEDKSVRVDYIKLVLELSELCAEQNLEVWYLEDELISPCLFEELQSQGDQTDDLKLLFDCICEALTEIQERYFRLSSWLTFLKHDIRTPPIGENLITEVDRYVYRYIQYSLPSTLEQIIKRDLEVETWMNIRSKTEDIVMEIWEFVLDELIDETVFDLWI